MIAVRITKLSFEDVANITWTAFFDAAEDYVPNPGMGFIGYAHSDHMCKGKFNRSEYNLPSREDLERLISNPYCNNVYLRVEWRDVQTEKGKLNFIPLWEETIELCRKYGKTWSFRIMSASNANRYEKAGLPPFLFDKVTLRPYPNDEIENETAYFPVYDDIYLNAWSEMIHLLGEKYDKDPNLEWADISGYGKWGEFHHWPCDHSIEGYPDMDDPKADPIAIKRIIDEHVSAFPDTPAVSMGTPSWDYETSSWKDKAKLYAFDRYKCWIRRDSFYPVYSAWEYDITRQVQDYGGALIFEPGFYPGTTRYEDAAIQTMHYGQVFDRLLDLNPAYIALGFNPWQAFRTLEEYSDMVRRASLRIGYRIRPAVVRMSTIEDNGRKRVSIGFKNDGVCNPSGTLIVTLKFNSGEVVTRELPAGFPQPGRMEFFDFVLPDQFDKHTDDNYFTLSASLRMWGKTRPVAWTVKQTRDNPDRYNLVVRVPV